jgi:hypothetical protein
VIGFTALGWYPLLGAVLASVAFVRWSYGWERLGLLAGVGVGISYFGSLHTGSTGGSHWLIVGIAIAVVAATLYWLHDRLSSHGGL